MDNKDQRKRFDWLPVEMPGVSRLVKEKRALLGDTHVAECWKRGVLQREAGWFFAREGAISIGVPWDEPEMANFAAQHISSTQALLVIKMPEAPHGAH